MQRCRCVPPAPEVMAALYAEYRRIAQGQGLTFKQYLATIGYSNPAEGVTGMDDGTRFSHVDGGAALISIPSQPIVGELHVKVLLVDFSDRTGTLPVSHYENLLFSKDLHPTGSMRDYYREVSLGKVNVTGTIHGWLRMPQSYAFYTNGESGLTWASYPRNAPRMAEDAVRTALHNGVTFEPNLDALRQGIITALFIVHAGRGAEELHPSLRGHDIWSHKWNLRQPIAVAPGLSATIYLTVPHDCKVGVCAHELGHLAFQWEDFYDPNYNEDGTEWDGSGAWDLMAGGSYNGNGMRPAHPAALHKSQHHWITIEEIRASTALTLDPYTPSAGKAVRLISPRYKAGQYLMLENRQRHGFDADLPGAGLLVWQVDESREMFAPDRPALLLIQADGRHQLETAQDWNQGDAGDPFPGSTNRLELGDTGDISTSFPDGDEAGITLTNIRQDPVTGVITLQVQFAGEVPSDTTAEVIEQRVTPARAIPDLNAEGLRSTIQINRNGLAAEIAVEVDIRHTYIGDLQVELIAPSGQRAMLHNRTGNNTALLQKTYRSSTDASLAVLLGNAVQGTWTLRVVDAARFDTGTLQAWGLAIRLQPETTAVHGAASPGLRIPDNDPAGVASTIRVARAGTARTVTVGVDITHSYIGDLRLEVTNPSGDRAILHDRVGGDTRNLSRSYASSQVPSLATFVGKAIKGDWTLRATDLAGSDLGTLNTWTLDIDTVAGVQVFEQEKTPALPIPDNNPAGVGSVITIGVSGTAQAIEVGVAITHTYIGDLRVELVAPSGERGILHNRTGGRTHDLRLELNAASAATLAPLLGQPVQGSWIVRVTDLAGDDVGTLDRWHLRVTYVQ